ncbi:MAG TPA: GNAT family N-acetyltransferase, partial [Holophagaceae bacterium]|nr:GNAT family N-acetyltransferase [Holophagaceae bacterium]
HEKQKMRLFTLSEDWMPVLAARFGAAFRTTVLRRLTDGRLVGFITTLKDRDGAIGYTVGFDKETAAAGVPLYLRLLYAMVEDALSLGAAWASLGRTALEPKAKLGARPQPLCCHLRHRIPAMNSVVTALLRVLPEPAQAPERKPFKGGA